MQIKHILIILAIHSFFALCLCRILKRILSAMYCQQMIQTAGISSLPSSGVEEEMTQNSLLGSRILKIFLRFES